MLDASGSTNKQISNAVVAVALISSRNEVPISRSNLNIGIEAILIGRRKYMRRCFDLVMADFRPVDVA